MLDPDTWVFPGSRPGGPAGGGGGHRGGLVCHGRQRTGGPLSGRPPGHHARPSAGMGFCIYANVALAAAEALARFDLNRILIADFDVHHGNGTQEIFYDSARSASCRSIATRSILAPARRTKPAPATGLGFDA